MAARPGPLQDIQLHHERLQIRTDGELRATARLLIKRSSSPSSHPLCSPSKRRLVHIEGQGKTLSGPSTPHTSRMQTILHSPNSPARKLDFGSALHGGSAIGDENITSESESPYPLPCDSPRQLSSNLALLPSLYDSSSNPLSTQHRQIAAIDSRRTSADMEMTDCSQHQAHTLPPSTQYEPASREVRHPCLSSRHYPGFTVYQDTYNYVYHIATLSSASANRIDDECNRDFGKENIRPALPLKTYIGEPAWAKAGLSCPRDVEMVSPGKLSPIDIRTTHLEMAYAQRSIRDIGNIREGILGGRRDVNTALTSNAFLLLDQQPEEQEPAKSRWKAESRKQDCMEVENRNAVRNEA